MEKKCSIATNNRLTSAHHRLHNLTFTTHSQAVWHTHTLSLSLLAHSFILWVDMFFFCRYKYSTYPVRDHKAKRSDGP